MKAPGSMTIDIEPIYEEIRKLKWLLHHDVLTGLPNELTLQRRLTEVEGGWFVLIDLDGFKQYQDRRRSHRAGDRVICEFADFLRSTAQKVGSSGPDPLSVRLHGDEFVVWTENESDAQKFRKLISQWENSEQGVTASVGVGPTLDTADRNMYQSKQRKKLRQACELEPAVNS